MQRSILATASLAALVALSACSSNDDDDDTPNVGVESGDDSTSEVAEDREVADSPGGPTPDIAGFWDASGTAPEATADARLVLFTDDGLATSYERQIVDGTTDEVCYSRAGPQTLTPNGDDVYTPADGSAAFTAVRVDGEDTLTVTTPDLTETWTLETDSFPDDLPLCLDTESDVEPAGGENVLPGEDDLETDPGGTSMLAPGGGEDTPPRSDPSGSDTSAIAGLWNATSGEAPRVDERYVLISEDGLYTDYDYRDDAFGGEGNCYLVTPLALELEATDGDSATYSVAGGRTFEAAPAAAGTLAVSFDGVGGESWPAVTGQDASDLATCDAG